MSIRMATLQDAPALLAIYTPYVEKTAITFEYEPPTEQEFSRRIAEVLKRYPYLVVEEQGELLGYAYASPFKERAAYDWAVETSIYVREDARGKGYGRALYRALEAILSRQHIRNVNACIAYAQVEDALLTNDSMRFHERMGYREVAHFHQCGYKLGRWYDMIWMEKMLGNREQEALPVLPVHEAVAPGELFP